MNEDNKPRGVPLSPKSMVDSVADWPLHRVVEHLRKKEKEEHWETTQLSCRSSIKSLVTVMDGLATGYGVSRNRISCWLSYHGLTFAREDATIAKLQSVRSGIREIALLVDDTDTIDLMESLIPYSPRFQDSDFIHLPMYDWVSSEFDDLARSCGVHKYQIAQLFICKSILTDDIDRIAGAASRLSEEVSRWNKWMRFRLGAMEGLSGGEK